MSDPALDKSSFATIQRSLDEVRMRFARRTALELFVLYSAVAVALLFAITVVLTLIATEAWFGWVRVIALGVLLTMVAIGHGMRRQHTLREDGVVAERIERTLPSYRTDIRGALDLARRHSNSEMSASLRTALLQRVAGDLSGDRRLDRVVPRPSLRRPISTAAVAIASAIALFLGSTSYRDGADRLLHAPDHVIAAALAETNRMLVTAVDLQLTYPSYTRHVPSGDPAQHRGHRRARGHTG